MINLCFNIHKVPRFKFFVSNTLLIKQYFKLLTAPLIRSNKSTEFESLFANYMKSSECISVSSFRIGLHYSLQALQLSEGDEILLSPITIPDTINIILLLKLKPVFVDMSLADHALDLKSLRLQKTTKTKVVLVTHLSGIPANIIEIKEYCANESLILIEDFSQNIGGKIQNKSLGTFGDIGICSLSRGKTLTSMSGGLIISDNHELMKKIRLDSLSKIPPSKNAFRYYIEYNLKINLITSKYFFNFFTFFGLLLLSRIRPKSWLSIEPEEQNKVDIFYDNVPILRTVIPQIFFSYFSDWQASMAKELLNNLEKNNDKRRQLAKLLISACNLKVKNLIPTSLLDIQSNTIYHFPINCTYSDRNKLLKHLLDNGVDSAGYGLNLCSEEIVFKNYSVKLPIAESIKHASIFLPIHESYGPKEVKTIAHALNSFYN